MTIPVLVLEGSPGKPRTPSISVYPVAKPLYCDYQEAALPIRF